MTKAPSSTSSTSPSGPSEPVGHRRVVDAVEPLDGTPYVDLLVERFGIPRTLFADYVVFQANRKTLWIVDRHLELPHRPDPYQLGMPFFYVNMKFPRPTTGAAVKFGVHAERNLFDASDDELSMLVYREDIRLDASRVMFDGQGYVMLRHRGAVLGLGYYRPATPEEDPEGAGGGWLRGMTPRSWTVRLGVPAPAVDLFADVDPAAPPPPTR